MMKINIDEKALQKMMKPKVEALERDITKISVSHRGRPVGQVLAALERAARAHGMESGPALREVAQRISAEQG